MNRDTFAIDMLRLYGSLAPRGGVFRPGLGDIRRYPDPGCGVTMQMVESRGSVLAARKQRE
jgi:hypothetical protein